ncbi:MAG: SAM-dependent chlorinase/fluorinase [Anaerolineae bacterium]|nr:SAM-dependent chlorinase/fluorinase [Anaerolineae bacterium]
MSPIVALLTDFGLQDNYVGVMKAVMSRITADVRFIDITHQIQPQNVRQASLTLLNSYRYFAPSTVFLVVVDPGVGGSRKCIAAEAGGYRFVAPDNGVLSFVLEELGSASIVELQNPAYRLSDVSNTFHGRDVFAPAAAHLAAGVALGELGPRVERIAQQMKPQLRIEAGQISGQVMHIDRFGNVITSIGQLSWNEQGLLLQPRFNRGLAATVIPAAQVSVAVKDATLFGIRRSYSEVSKGQLLALVDSSGFLEIACNQGSAATLLGVNGGESVVLKTG